MANRVALCSLCSAIFIASHLSATVQARAFFVLGSSYVDTGNVSPSDKSRSFPWRVPYGKSWPGLPAGRYSNGRVFTDILAAAMNLSVPTLYNQRLEGRKYDTGMNFATAGSGVLSAYGYPPVSSQIETLETILRSYNQSELSSAFLLYVTAGEDYFYSLTVQSTPLAEIYPLTVSVGKQIANDLIKLYGLGLRNFAVTTLPPVGCLPMATRMNSFSACNESWSTSVTNAHNARVWKNLNGLKHYFKNSTLTVLDFYSTFKTVLDDHAKFGSSQSLVPCCVGSDDESKCSSVDPSGRPMYSVCSSPSLKFFWDDLFHPSEAAWQAIVKLLMPSLPTLSN